MCKIAHFGANFASWMSEIAYFGRISIKIKRSWRLTVGFQCKKLNCACLIDHAAERNWLITYFSSRFALCYYWDISDLWCCFVGNPNCRVCVLCEMSLCTHHTPIGINVFLRVFFFLRCWYFFPLPNLSIFLSFLFSCFLFSLTVSGIIVFLSPYSGSVSGWVSPQDRCSK